MVPARRSTGRPSSAPDGAAPGVTRLARLRVDGGDPAAASALLGPILGSLTEGFETADVREGRELLEAVATP